MDGLTYSDVKDWSLSTDGTFHVRDAMRELKVHKEDEQKLRTYLSRLVTEGVLERVGGKMGNYRLIQTEWEPIDIFGKTQFFNLTFPVPIQKYARVGRGGLFVVAGEKDAGKTGFLLNVAMANADSYKVRYFECGEPGPDLMKERILAMRPGIESLPFELLSLDGEPQDCLKAYPNDITILDYVTVPPDAWRMVEVMRKCSNALQNRGGMGIIALQKPKGRDDAYGGQQVKDKAQVYIALEAKDSQGYWKSKIVTAKSRVHSMIDPVGKEWKYHIKNFGTEFADMDPNDWVDTSVPFPVEHRV